MKPVLKKLILLSVSFVFLTVFTASFNAQAHIDLEHHTAKLVADLLHKNYSAVVGNVVDFQNWNLTFSIEEKLLGDYPIQGRDEFLNEKDLVRFNPTAGDAIREIQIGSKMIIFLRKHDDGTKDGYIISDERWFLSVRKSIAHFINYKKNPEMLRQIPELIKGERDETFINYLFEFASGPEPLSQANDMALVLNQLITIDKVSILCAITVINSLADLVAANAVVRISSATRERILRNLFDLASRNTPGAFLAIAVLERVARIGSTDLRPYLTLRNKIGIRENFRTTLNPFANKENRRALELQMID